MDVNPGEAEAVQVGEGILSTAKESRMLSGHGAWACETTAQQAQNNIIPQIRRLTSASYSGSISS